MNTRLSIKECKYCDATLWEQTALITHVNTTHICDLCDMVFATEQAKATHVTLIHGELISALTSLGGKKN